MKALSARLARLEQQRPPPIVAHEGPDVEVFKEKLRRVLEQPDHQELLPASEQVALRLANYAQVLEERKTRDPNPGRVEGLGAFHDKLLVVLVAQLRGASKPRRPLPSDHGSRSWQSRNASGSWQRRLQALART